MAFPKGAFAAFSWRTCNLHGRHQDQYSVETVLHYPQDLCQALENRDLSGVIKSIKHGIKWKNADQYVESVFHIAVKKRCTEANEQKEVVKILEWFLKQKKLNVNVKCRAGSTALHIAAKNGMIEVVDYLIKQGADLNIRDKQGDSIVHYMIKGEFERYMKLCKTASSADDLRPFYRESVQFFNRMLSKKIKIDCYNKNRETPLQLAIKRNLLHILPILLEYTEDIKFRDKEKKTVLHLFVETFKSCNHVYASKYYKTNSISTSYYDKALIIDILKMMLIKGYSVGDIDDQGNTALHSAAYRACPEIIEVMLKDFKKVNICNNDGNTILHIIIGNSVDRTSRQHKKEYVRFVDILLSKGADIHKRNKIGYKPMHIAVMRAHSTILNILNSHGADLKESYDRGNLLHLLSRKASKIINPSKVEDVIGLLVNHGIDVNAKDKDGMTPMHLAVKSKRNAVISGLIKWHANVDARQLCVHRYTPLQIAVAENCDISIDILVNFGADINAKDSTGKTALHLAMSFKTETMKILLKLGAHVDVEDDDKLLPLHYAIRNQNGVAVGELLKYGADINDFITYQELVSLTETDYVFSFILKHWIKMKVVGLPIASFYGKYALESNFRQLYQDCLKEIEDLKVYNIADHTSLYDLLHMDWNSRCVYTVNKSFKDLIESTILQKKFPKYYVLILASYHNAVARQPLLEPAKRAWCEFTKIILPNVCVYRILAHLNNRDLRNMVDGLKDRNFRKPCKLLLNVERRCFN